MPWNLSGTIIREGRSWVDASGIRHPTNWMRWTDAEKEAAGLAWTADVAPHDNRFYWGRNADGDLLPKAVADLKVAAIATAKSQAAGYLAPYDWYVTRHAEKTTAIPSAITTYRDAVRTACAAIEGRITGAANFAAFIALYDTPESGNAPINDWPDAL